MVIQHVYGLADIFRKRMDSILERVGTKTYTLYTQVETGNAMGRIKTSDPTTSIITGFLHKITPQDKQFLDLGIMNIGDGIFYASHDVSLKENDEVAEVNVTDERWKLTKKIDNEKIQGNPVYQAWAITKVAV